MTVKHYDITALKTSRQQIISALKSIHLQPGKQYKLSAATSASLAFSLHIVSKSAMLTKQIKAAIKKQLKRSVEVKGEGGSLQIILGSLYTDSLQKHQAWTFR